MFMRSTYTEALLSQNVPVGSSVRLKSLINIHHAGTIIKTWQELSLTQDVRNDDLQEMQVFL